MSTPTKRARKSDPGNPSTGNPSTDHSFSGLVTWLTNQGALHLSNLYIAPSSLVNGGTGLFTTSPLPSSICTIPSSAILSHARAFKDAVMTPLLKGVPAVAKERDLVLFIYMAVCREDPTHALYIYLSTLPREPQGFVAWDKRFQEMVKETALGASVGESLKEIARFQEIVEGLPAPYNIPLSSLTWAYDMYYSRRYPMKLAPHLPQSDTDGILVPFLDRLNHRDGEAIEWVGSDDGVTMRTLLPDGVLAGAEVFQNYGVKSTLTMLLHYGFVSEENANDCYPVVMKAVVDGVVERKGPFMVRRKGSGLGEQFPEELWRAMGSVTGEPSPDDAECLLEVLLRQRDGLRPVLKRVVGDDYGAGCVRVYLKSAIMVLGDAISSLDKIVNEAEEVELKTCVMEPPEGEVCEFGVGQSVVTDGETEDYSTYEVLDVAYVGIEERDTGYDDPGWMLEIMRLEGEAMVYASDCREDL